ESVLLASPNPTQSPSWKPDFLDESRPYRGHRITREDWTITCSSSASGHPCRKAIDGNSTTTWRSDPSDKGHEIIIDLGAWYQVSGLVILPPNGTDTKGLITHHKIWVSKERDSWPESPVAYGMWPNTNIQRMSAFEPSSTRYLKITIDADQKDPWVGISELNIYGTLYTMHRNPALGVWGPTLDFPIVPVSAAQEGSGKLALWSSWADDQFHSTPGGKTVMTRWDPRTEEVTNRTVTETHHDMFCPGISYDSTGMMVVTGGNDASETRLFNSVTNNWTSASEMKLRRGYQASATLSDGRVFVIGGSWAGGSNYDKDGEVYDPATKNWTMLPDAKVCPMKTKDMEGAWRADNHGWLFGWKNLSIFQAGPSKNMNWYSAHGNGSVEPAGLRMNDRDSMSGNAIMFDAVKGKILTVGGSPSYDKTFGTNHAHIITNGEPNETPKVEPAAGGTMHRKRVFHTTVVLPDGKVAIFGGQRYGVAFNEENVQLSPEIYDPAKNTFTELQLNNIVRVYHSVSILLPDGRVLNAGGGLCGNCTANHYDGQIFTPPYLLTNSGEPRPRPEILSELEDYTVVGSTLESKSPAVSSQLPRSTHTVNTDQRHIPLDLELVSHAENTYKTTLPEDSGILIPGYWVLFVMDNEGAPSIAKIMMVGLDKKRTIQPAQDPLGLLEAQNSKHGLLLTFRKSW
ncbi:unnamed protein product, partial [Penicillium nalgiovense]